MSSIVNALKNLQKKGVSFESPAYPDAQPPSGQGAALAKQSIHTAATDLRDVTEDQSVELVAGRQDMDTSMASSLDRIDELIAAAHAVELPTAVDSQDRWDVLASSLEDQAIQASLAEFADTIANVDGPHTEQDTADNASSLSGDELPCHTGHDEDGATAYADPSHAAYDTGVPDPSDSREPDPSASREPDTSASGEPDASASREPDTSDSGEPDTSAVDSRESVVLTEPLPASELVPQAELIAESEAEPPAERWENAEPSVESVPVTATQLMPTQESDSAWGTQDAEVDGKIAEEPVLEEGFTEPLAVVEGATELLNAEVMVSDQASEDERLGTDDVDNALPVLEPLAAEEVDVSETGEEPSDAAESTWILPDQQATEAAEIAESEVIRHRSVIVPSEPELTEDILSVLAEVERVHAGDVRELRDRSALTPSLDLQATEIFGRMGTIAGNGPDVPQPSEEQAPAPDGVSFEEDWNEVQPPPRYADLLADAPLDELADWGSLHALTHLEPEAAEPNDTTELLDDIVGSPPADVEPSEEPMDALESLVAVATGASGVPVAEASTDGAAPTAWEFEVLRRLEEPTIRQAYDALAQHVREALPQNRPAVVALFSVEPEQHVAETLSYLAILLSRSHTDQVLLLDANLTLQALTKGYQAQGREGFADLLQHKSCPSHLLGRMAVRTSQNGVAMMAAGGRVDRQSVGQESVVALFQRCGEHYPITLVDAGVVGEGLADKLARAADLVYLLVRLGTAEKTDACAAKERLEQLGVTISGCIATNASL